MSTSEEDIATALQKVVIRLAESRLRSEGWAKGDDGWRKKGEDRLYSFQEALEESAEKFMECLRYNRMREKAMQKSPGELWR